MANSYTIIGLMSGTSCDGLDISVCQYNKGKNDHWDYQLHIAETVDYPDNLRTKLRGAINLNSNDLYLLDKEFAHFTADVVNDIKNRFKTKVDAIASHGHTVHHRPDLGYTVQIGCGETLAFLTGLKVINNFRQKDVAAGGQGAPLVPIGDKLLFNTKADAFLNIGGFCNISFVRNEVIAFDVCPGNLPLNKLVSSLDHAYDEGGNIAKSGKLKSELLEKLNSLPYYKSEAPKSLGVEWLESSFYPIFSDLPSTQDALRTIVEHIAIQIASSLKEYKAQKVLITGGGAKNSFLVDRICYHFNDEVIIPDNELVDFKEAIIFGFLGVLNLEEQPNCISNVTGASRDVVGGEIHLP